MGGAADGGGRPSNHSVYFSTEPAVRARSSAGERVVHTDEVTGSIPVAPTKSAANPSDLWGLFATREVSLAAVTEPPPWGITSHS